MIASVSIIHHPNYTEIVYCINRKDFANFHDYYKALQDLAQSVFLTDDEIESGIVHKSMDDFPW